MTDNLMRNIHKSIHDAGGWLCFDAYMQACLYDPHLGYYTRTNKGIGSDFKTAPEMGSLLAQLIAAFIKPICFDPPCHLAEFGAGSGALCRDIIDALNYYKIEDIRYKIVEISDKLRENQRSTLVESCQINQVCWEDFENFECADAVILANEFFDAWPCKRFVHTELGFVQLGIAIDEQSGQLCWRNAPFDADFDCIIQEQTQELNLPIGYRGEWCPTTATWFAQLAKKVTNSLFLVIDYGYEKKAFYHTQRTDGTLCAYYQHRLKDPLEKPGMYDLSCHVNFSELAHRATACGFSVLGYCDLAHFCLSSELITSTELSAQQRACLGALTDPQGLGLSFKVMALGKGFDAKKMPSDMEYGSRIALL